MAQTFISVGQQVQLFATASLANGTTQGVTTSRCGSHKSIRDVWSATDWPPRTALAASQ
jgi:hypothetical protein